ncbi:hypothetical protein MASS_1396 [Mycobacteroides abscessus subsp. bolletii 50594]|uniref:Uncharacterized protein n=1 Tax=Mycobacteroides abscessus subsp. bolletii 50594 TaxID=1303024 RepID=A0AB33A8C2_9MYCO|nr:hypothetical protein MASS_1396 [Mycobacteroides abscessus subsp. bolletii 50594]
MQAERAAEVLARPEPGGKCGVRAHQPQRGDHGFGQQFGGVVDPGDVLGDLPGDHSGGTMHIRDVQSLAILKVPVEGGAGTTGSPGDFVHANGRDAVAHE